MEDSRHRHHHHKEGPISSRPGRALRSASLGDGSGAAAAAAAAANSTTAASTSSSCDRCVDLLRHVLSLPESLPHRLLRSLTSPTGTTLAPAVTRSNSSSNSSNSNIRRSNGSLISARGGPISSSMSSSISPSPPALVTRVVDGGIQVQIPADDPMMERRHWRELLPLLAAGTTVHGSTDEKDVTSTVAASNKPKRAAEGSSGADPALASPASLSNVSSSSSSEPSHPLQLQRLATSPSRNSLETDLPSQETFGKKLEWLTFKCRHCSDVGPEGGARAFVMGPNPLSVVVCHNRLLQRQVTATTTLAASGQDGSASPASFMFPSASSDNNIDIDSSSSRISDRPTSQSEPAPAVAAPAPAPAATPQFSSSSVDEMTEILSHELSHVYDVRQLLLDLRDCENLAYSEVRAARIAECRNNSDGGGGSGGQHIGGDGGAGSAGIGFGGLRSWYLPSYYSSSNNNHSSGMHQQRSCVRQKAVTATLNLFPGQARSCLNAVFDAAMADHRPILPPPTAPVKPKPTPPSNSAGAVQSVLSAAAQTARPASLFRAPTSLASDTSPSAPACPTKSSPSGASPCSNR